MLATVLGYLSDIATQILGAMGGVVGLWPVAVMAGFLILGTGISFVTKLAGGRKGGRKRRRA